MYSVSHVVLCYSSQILALCPGRLHLLHTRTLFAAGGSKIGGGKLLVTVGTGEVNTQVDVAVGGLAVDCGVTGLGDTKSCTSSEQYSLMLL